MAWKAGVSMAGKVGPSAQRWSDIDPERQRRAANAADERLRRRLAVLCPGVVHAMAGRPTEGAVFLALWMVAPVWIHWLSGRTSALLPGTRPLAQCRRIIRAWVALMALQVVVVVSIVTLAVSALGGAADPGAELDRSGEIALPSVPTFMQRP